MPIRRRKLPGKKITAVPEITASFTSFRNGSLTGSVTVRVLKPGTWTYKVVLVGSGSGGNGNGGGGGGVVMVTRTAVDGQVLACSIGQGTFAPSNGNQTSVGADAANGGGASGAFGGASPGGTFGPGFPGGGGCGVSCCLNPPCPPNPQDGCGGGGGGGGGGGPGTDAHCAGGCICSAGAGGPPAVTPYGAFGAGGAGNRTFNGQGNSPQNGADGTGNGGSQNFSRGGNGRIIFAFDPSAISITMN